MSSRLLNMSCCPPKLVKSSGNKSLTCKLRKKVVQLYYIAFNKLHFISHQGIKKGVYLELFNPFNFQCN